jgi:hypothetical protein
MAGWGGLAHSWQAESTYYAPDSACLEAWGHLSHPPAL